MKEFSDLQQKQKTESALRFQMSNLGQAAKQSMKILGMEHI